MGNIFDTCKKKNTKIYNGYLFEKLNTTRDDLYSSVNLYNNLDFIEINDKIDKLINRIKLCENNITILEQNTQENIQLLSQDIHHINNKLKIEPPAVI